MITISFYAGVRVKSGIQSKGKTDSCVSTLKQFFWPCWHYCYSPVVVTRQRNWRPRPSPCPRAKLLFSRDPGGKEWPLFKGVSLDQVMEIMRKAGPGSRQGAGEDWQGELVFTAPGGKEHYDLYAGCIRHCGLAYALDPDQIQLLRDCFEREILEIQGLVRIKDLDDSIIIDLKYATADNFTGQVIYPAAVGVIKRETGERLVEANKIFREKRPDHKGLGTHTAPFPTSSGCGKLFPIPVT